MGWVTLSMRKMELKQEISDLQMKQIKLSREQSKLQKLSSAIAKGTMSLDDLADCPTELQDTLDRYMAESFNDIITSGKLDQDYNYDVANNRNYWNGMQQATGNENYDDQTHIQDPAELKQRILEKLLKEYAQEWTQQWIKPQEDAIEQELEQTKVQTEQANAEIQAYDQAISQDIQQNVPKFA